MKITNEVIELINKGIACNLFHHESRGVITTIKDVELITKLIEKSKHLTLEVLTNVIDANEYINEHGLTKYWYFFIYIKGGVKMFIEIDKNENVRNIMNKYFTTSFNWQVYSDSYLYTIGVPFNLEHAKGIALENSK